MRAGALVLLVAMGLAVPVSASAQTSLAFEGRVVEAGTTSGIQNAVVSVEGVGAVLTSAEGAFRFRSVRPGTYAVRVTALGYATATRSLTISTNASVTIALEVAPLALDALRVVVELIDVEGRVRDPEVGFFLVDAEVLTVLGLASGTDTRGRFRLRGVLRDDSLRIYVRAFGYLPLDTTIVPEADEQYLFDLSEDPLMRAMAEIQVERLERRATPRFAAGFRNLAREGVLRYAGRHSVLSLLIFEYGQWKLDRLGCVVIDEKPYEKNSSAGFMVGAILNHMVPEEVEKIEFMFRGRMLRIYTRAFIQEMTAGEIELISMPLIFPMCI